MLGAVFTWLAVRLLRDSSPQAAMRLFTWSITYITLLFGAMAARPAGALGAVGEDEGPECLTCDFVGSTPHVTRFPSWTRLLLWVHE